MTQATDTVWLPVLPSMKGFGPALIRGASGPARTQGRILGSTFGRAIVAGATAAAAGVAAVGAILYNTGRTFEDVQNTIRVGTGATGSALDDLVSSAKNIGQTVPASFDDISSTVADLNTGLGLTGQPLEDMSTRILELTRITGGDLSTNVNRAVRLFGDWDISAEDSAEALDKLYRTSQTAGIEFDALTGLMTDFGAPLRQLGFSFDESAALMGKWEREGVNTQTVLGGLRQALSRFARDGKDAATEFPKVVDEIANMGDAGEATALAIETFGARAGPDMAAAIREGRFEIEDYLDAIENGDDTIMQAAEDTMTWREQLRILSNNIAVWIEPVATRFLELLNEGVTAATGAIQDFVAAWQGDDVPGLFGDLGRAAKDMVDRLMEFGGWVYDNRSTIMGFATTLGGLVAGIYAARTAITIIRTAKALWAAQNSILLLSTIALSGGIRGIGLAIRSIPVIGWIITLIGALGGFFAWFFTQTETGQRWWETAWDAIKRATAVVVDWFMNTALPFLQRVWDGIKVGLAWLNDRVIQPIWSAIKFGWGLLVDYISWYWENVLKPVWNTIATVATWLWENVLKPAWSNIRLGWRITVRLIQEWWNNVLKPTWDTVATVATWLWENVLQPAFQNIRDAWGRMVDRMKWYWDNILNPVITLIGDIIMWLWNNVAKPYFKNIWEGFKIMAGWIRHHWRETIKPALDTFMDVVGILWKSHIKPTLEWISDKWGWVSGKIKDFWEDTIKPALNEFKDFISEEVAPRVESGVDMIGRAWARVQDLFRTPINWVINTVWNGGIVSAFNAVAIAVGSDERLPTIDPLEAPRGGDSRLGRSPIRRARGGAVSGPGTGTSDDIPAWLSNGEHVLTADEVKQLGGQDAVYDLRRRIRRGEDVDPEASRILAGGHPSEALLPMGGGLAGLLRGAGRAASGLLDLVRGNLVDYIRGKVDPLLKSAQGAMGAYGQMGTLSGDWLAKMVNHVFDWAKGEDDKAGEFGEFAGAFTGPTGDWRRPSAGPITSWYGPRWGTIHSGIDIAGGGPTFAAYNGVVSRTGWNIVPGRTGIGILLNHGGQMYTYYGHNPVGGVRVSPGDQVRAGQRIGAQGATGNVTGTHLHWELHRGGVGRAVNVNSMFRDKGGLIYPGMNLVRNETGGAEYVFNQSQFDNLNRIAEGGHGGGGFTANIYGVPTDNAQATVNAFARHQRRAERGGAHAVSHR